MKKALCDCLLNLLASWKVIFLCLNRNKFSLPCIDPPYKISRARVWCALIKLMLGISGHGTCDMRWLLIAYTQFLHDILADDIPYCTGYIHNKKILPDIEEEAIRLAYKLSNYLDS